MAPYTPPPIRNLAHVPFDLLTNYKYRLPIRYLSQLFPFVTKTDQERLLRRFSTFKRFNEIPYTVMKAFMEASCRLKAAGIGDVFDLSSFFAQNE
jgi:hypothetical protein